MDQPNLVSVSELEQQSFLMEHPLAVQDVFTTNETDRPVNQTSYIENGRTIARTTMDSRGTIYEIADE